MQVEHTADCFGGAWFKSPLLTSRHLLYTADVLNIVQHLGLAAHSYADDTCIYVHVDAVACVTSRYRCLDAMNLWMASNRLKLSRTQFVWLGLHCAAAN